MDKINLERAINASKNIMNNALNETDAKHSGLYLHMNDDIKMSLENLNFNKEKALSVMAGGDQVFNLIYSGVKNIDAFDKNVLTYFIFHLRRAIFLAYGYEKSSEIENLFMDFNCNPQKLLEILNILKLFMPNDVYMYFEEILKYNYYLSISKNSSNLFPFIYGNRRGIGNNLYDRKRAYANRSVFQKLQDNLDKSSVNFIESDIQDLPDFLEEEYDLMYFSNIVEYYIKKYGEREFMELMWQLYPYLKSKGIIVNYFFDRYNLDMVGLNMSYFRKLGFNGNIRVRSKNHDSALIMRKR